MNIKVVLVTLLGVSCVLCGCDLSSKSANIAVINTREVLTKCNAGLKITEDIQQKFKDINEALAREKDAIAALRNDPGLSDPKSNKKDELQRLAQHFVDASQKLRNDVGEEEASRFKPVVDRINKALAQYAKEHTLIAVQDKNGFAYIDPSIDITEAIIKKVDEAK